jgi:predicted esterase YcpF (UPF0227 family)
MREIKIKSNRRNNNSKLYYIHGYLSSPDSTKGQLFKEKLDAKPIKYRDCEPEDLVISDCIKRISNEIKDDPDVVLIGSSLGGLLAAKTALDRSNVKKLVLLNPATIPPTVDVNTIHDMPVRILSEMKDLRLFEEKINAEITILAGLEDDVIPASWILDFATAQKATIKFLHDDHSFTKNIDKLPGIIAEIIGL